MLNVNITAKHVSISLKAASSELELSERREITARDIHALEWSETLLDGDRVDYATAEQAVSKLGEGWRLPTRKELESLIDITRHDPAIDTDKYPDTKSSSYWSSSPCAWNESARWVVGFFGGSVGANPQDDGACVRAVRASQ